MKRNIAIDYLRSSVTVLVVAHHAAMAYNSFSYYVPANYMRSSAPIVDVQRWMPLDLLVSWNDMYFMSLMFLISGLFTIPSIDRKGAASFVADRFKRLGIPFVAAVFVLSPLAYYPSWLLSTTASQGGFLQDFFWGGHWRGGPAWFLWVLLAFSTIFAFVCRIFPSIIPKLTWIADSPKRLVFTFLSVSLLTTLPFRYCFSADNWTSLAGPFVFQTWRILLYFSWFVLGAMIGNGRLESTFSVKNLSSWRLWMFLGLLAYAVNGLMELKFGIAPGVTGVALAAIYSCCCTLTSLAAVGLAYSSFRTPVALADNLTENAFGIYVFHYFWVTWIQFALMGQAWHAAAKFLIVFTVSLSGSWFLTNMLRKTPLRRFL